MVGHENAGVVSCLVALGGIVHGLQRLDERPKPKNKTQVEQAEAQLMRFWESAPFGRKIKVTCNRERCIKRL
jgi:hypothetical protein